MAEPTPPVLAPLARELLASERLQQFLAGPVAARVSEPLLPLFVAACWLGREGTAPLTIVVPDDADARDLAEAVGWYLGPEIVGLFASRGVRHATGIAPAPHLVGERARALDVLARGGIVCASAVGYAEGIPPQHARPQALRIAPGDEPGVDGLARALALAGYERVEQVESRGQFAVRGGLVDVYPSTGREPLRIELFGDEIEAVRVFSVFTQRTLARLDEALVQPACERRLDGAELEQPDAAWDADAAWEAGGADSADAGSGDLVAPLPGCDLVWSLDEARRAVVEELGVELDVGDAVALDPFPRGQEITFEAQRPAIAARGLTEAERDLVGLRKSGQRVLVTFQHEGEARRQEALLRKLDVELVLPGDTNDLAASGDSGSVRFLVGPARRGFVSRELGVVLVPDTQVFRKRPPRSDARVGRALQSFADLRTGDYVVHEDHGVGRLAGFETKTVAGVTRDYLFLEFRGDDKLYVPHEQIGKVSRYVGGDATPALSKLGGKSWLQIKTRAQSGARELAGELLAVYAARQQAEGIAYDTTGELVEQLETSFPYQETPDQQRAIEAVKEDLESTRPMDRLVCGDVGYGKTEVAIRAAFIAVANGRQALVLSPTTVLAQQHWRSFRERFEELPVNVEMVSRFRKPADVKRVLAEFGEGKVDVLIGTHRVLSRDVVPKNLGLVVVDEEQRFGVAQKELLRQLRSEVDLLALSATPIPRTLHMSLAGMRDISVIETPPEGRRPIRTHVGEYDDELVKQALEREAGRGGQSFFLHNRVESIQERAAALQQLCPDLRFLVGHGQLGERELEDVMLRFVAGDADVLVATTIIESGLDIPQANTLVVERADALGLAQLYQIRGRVGRSDQIAHAYLFYPDAEMLTAEARARLATLADHTELGAGFAIAMRDLEIRGAGNLLGAEQSGHVAAVGFELYVELLNEAVAELAGRARVATRPVRVDAQLDAYIPAAYIDAEALKIDLHRRLALLESEDELRELQVATEDRFGPLPEPVAHLFQIQEAKLKLARLGSDYLVYRGGRATVGPLLLGSAELKGLRALVDTAVYTTARREVSERVATFSGALELVDAILALRLAP